MNRQIEYIPKYYLFNESSEEKLKLKYHWFEECDEIKEEERDEYVKDYGEFGPKRYVNVYCKTICFEKNEETLFIVAKEIYDVEELKKLKNFCRCDSCKQTLTKETKIILMRLNKALVLIGVPVSILLTWFGWSIISWIIFVFIVLYLAMSIRMIFIQPCPCCHGCVRANIRKIKQENVDDARRNKIQNTLQ